MPTTSKAKPPPHGTSKRYDRWGCRCRRCTTAASTLKREQRARNPEYSKRAAERNRLRHIALREELSAYKIKLGCIDCGYNTHSAALDFDHQRDKDALISRLVWASSGSPASIARVWDEVAKCEVRCANCHRVRHWVTSISVHPIKPEAKRGRT